MINIRAIPTRTPIIAGSTDVVDPVGSFFAVSTNNINTGINK
jgi:hypothetical protein